MSFLYPRMVSISRESVDPSVGAVGYGGVSRTNEDVIATDLPASIQLKQGRGGPEAGLPADAAKTVWRIFIPRAAAALGAIETRDIVTDDLGQRYQVSGAYWNSLGHNLLCQLLEA